MRQTNIFVIVFHSSRFHHICNIKCRLNCRYSPQNISNAKNFNPHKMLISLLNVPICTQSMQRTWWPEASTIIVTGLYCSEELYKIWKLFNFLYNNLAHETHISTCMQHACNIPTRGLFQYKDSLKGIWIHSHYQGKTSVKPYSYGGNSYTGKKITYLKYN